MRYCFILIMLFSISIKAIASGENTFEGTYSIEYKNEKGETSKLNVSVKDSLVLLKN